MFYSVLTESQALAENALNAPGILLDLRESHQTGEGWASYLGVTQEDLKLKNGQNAAVLIVEKTSGDELTHPQRRKAFRQNALPQLERGILAGEETESDPLDLVAGLAMREASAILDDRDHPVGGYFDMTPYEWGLEVMKALRLLGGRRLKRVDKKGEGELAENLAASVGYVRATYLAASGR